MTLDYLKKAAGEKPLVAVIFNNEITTALYDRERCGLQLYNNKDTDDDYFPLAGDFIPDSNINECITIDDDTFMKQFI